MTVADEIFQERAGICEYSGLLTREKAEAQGLLESEKFKKEKGNEQKYRFECNEIWFAYDIKSSV